MSIVKYFAPALAKTFMRRSRYILFLLLAFNSAFCQTGNTPLLPELEKVREQADQYDKQKQQRIDDIKRLLSHTTGTQDHFNTCLQLFEEYKTFKYDSAYVYARELQSAASLLSDPNRIQQARLKLDFSLLSAGLFKEASESLAQTSISHMPDSLKTEYYLLMGRFYYDLADFNNDSYHSPVYVKSGKQYLDSALQLLDPQSFNYAYFTGLKDIRAGNKEKALTNYTALMSRPGLSNHEIALTASTLSDIYIQNQDNDKAIALLVQAAIADIRSSTKETSAAFNLANLLYKKGDVKNASSCIQLAIADATFYGTRQRKVRVSDILPWIESEKLGLVEQQKQTLITYAIIVTLLLLGVIVLIIIVYRQVQKLKIAKKIIIDAHLRDQEINCRLPEENHKLSEANRFKEEYIGYFFNALITLRNKWPVIANRTRLNSWSTIPACAFSLSSV